MGCSQSSNNVVDHEGNIVMNRRCIVLVCPPSFQTSKFMEAKPETLDYRFVSVGKLIRDQINKRTQYSKIIMENLAKYKKINQKILQILLKNLSLQGNFIIQFCPKDDEDLNIWRKFLKQVDIDLVAIFQPDKKAETSQQKSLYEHKLGEYQKDIQSIQQIVAQNLVQKIKNQESAWDQIQQTIKRKVKLEH